ncbi:MAG: SDR family NAD(P)-dependent oxidoreductase [Candidatus Nanohaloarchaea archaeon]
MKVLVTGAASGIGKATVEKLLEKGHEVVALDIDGESLEELSSEVEKYQADVYDENRVSNIIGDLELDAVVNSAGFYERGAVEDVDLETAESIFRANYFGAVNVIKAALPVLRQREGCVVNVSSVAGRVSMPFFGHYCASKHALEAMTGSLRMELHGTGVDTVLVEPGAIETGFNERARKAVAKYMPESFYTERYQEMLQGEGMRGVGPEKPAAKIVSALEASRPKKRYQSPLRAKLFVALEKVLPAGVREPLLRNL